MIVNHKYYARSKPPLTKKVQQIKCGITLHAIVGYCLVEKIFITF